MHSFSSSACLNSSFLFSFSSNFFCDSCSLNFTLHATTHTPARQCFAVLLSRPFLGLETKIETLAFSSRDQDRDLVLQVSRPRPRPGPSGLETKTETRSFSSRDQDRDLGLQVSRPRPRPWYGILEFNVPLNTV